MADLIKNLDDLKGVWMMGGEALPKASPSWKAAAEVDAYPELALLTLAGQSLQFACRPVPCADLRTTPLLPRLSLPTPPPKARQQIGYLVRVAKLSESHMVGVLRLLAARGYSIHPLDYMPRSFDDLPDLYSPWAAWQKSHETTDPLHAGMVIQSENWDEWMAADRRIAVANLRRENPAAARELVSAKISSLAADERSKMLEIFAERLSIEDQNLLESLANDRSAKVRQLAHQLLARLGITQNNVEDISEFAGFYSISKRLLKRTIKVAANPLKTDAQRKRRAELASQMSLQCLMRGLELASDVELVEGWEHGDTLASDEFVRLVAGTGSDASVKALAARITALEGISAESFQQLFNRLDNDSRRQLLPRILQNDDCSFSATLTCCQEMLGEIPWTDLANLRALKDLKKLCNDASPAKYGSQEKLRQGFYALGLLAEQTAAAELVRFFSEGEMLSSNPLFAVLQLNLFLSPGESA